MVERGKLRAEAEAGEGVIVCGSMLRLSQIKKRQRIYRIYRALEILAACSAALSVRLRVCGVTQVIITSNEH